MRKLSGEEFWFWFRDSVVVNTDGTPLLVHHGSVEDFEDFKKDKIRLNDYDAPFNGFWFSDDPNTSPAMKDAKFRKSYYLSLKNPAPHNVWRKMSSDVYNKDMMHPQARSLGDSVRLFLQDAGYDGIIWSDVPKVNVEEFSRKGRTMFTDVRGNKHALVYNEKWDGVDLYDIESYELFKKGHGEHIIVYESIGQYLSYQDRVYVVFEPDQIMRIK